ncbi:hypothetical protein PSACC_02388 [Paramicrosporidium saccamoebae]|uniref:Pre-mRNA-splicing factor 18 n=1 Tax=Paramicrosporidium saccamoebae TaxID=1246581 RepID=A0A2H9TJ78_9FUNG|nr:hypothetical protein PSACC_02388 [Paramicrosporidium saccamoebae]
MDFKDIIQAEILSKRKIYEERAGTKKYTRRGEFGGAEVTVDVDAAAGVDTGANVDVPIERREEHNEYEKHQNQNQNQHQHQHEHEHERKLEHIPDASVVKAATVVDPSVEVNTTDTPAVAAMVETSPSKKFDEALLVGVMETEPICAEDIKDDPAKLRSLISLFLRRLIREQGAVLAQRLPDDRSSREGKLATTVYQQCQDHLRPLFKHLRKDLLPADVLYSLATICGFMQQREYVKANDMYLKLAIGNAPWPIGVTAVGIHERSAQEKIKSNQVARM